jgi:hypothetical protein
VYRPIVIGNGTLAFKLFIADETFQHGFCLFDWVVKAHMHFSQIGPFEFFVANFANKVLFD